MTNQEFEAILKSRLDAANAELDARIEADIERMARNEPPPVCGIAYWLLKDSSPGFSAESPEFDAPVSVEVKP